MFKPCPLRVLVAAGNPLAMFSLRAQLSTLGYLVVAEAADGREAVSLARQLCPDVVVMDIELPNMDGLEASKHIDQEGLCPVVLLSENSNAEWVREACSLSAVQAYLIKPVHERDLEPAVELALARFQQIARLEREAGQLRNSMDACSTLTPATGDHVTKGSRLPQEAQERIQQGVNLDKAA